VLRSKGFFVLRAGDSSARSLAAWGNGVISRAGERHYDFVIAVGGPDFSAGGEACELKMLAFQPDAGQPLVPANREDAGTNRGHGVAP